mgnify:CR=1 FL=1
MARSDTVRAGEGFGGTGGAWQWELPAGGKPQAYELKLEQKYQAISGTVSVAGSTAKVTNARLRGEEIRFAFTVNINGQAVRHEFNGRINGDSVTGSAQLSGPRVQGQHDWYARRSAGAAAGRDEERLSYSRSTHGAFH